MGIKFHSTVIMTKNIEKLRVFYQEVLQQEVEVDFGTCIGFKNGFSLWQLTEAYPISKKLGRTFSASGNKNLELCFETDDFDAVLSKLKTFDIKYLHPKVEELWGQQTVRFFDPEDNLVEIGESIPCFVRRFYNQGLTVEEVSKRTSVPLEMVKSVCCG